MLERPGLRVTRMAPEARLVLHSAPEDRTSFGDLELPEPMLRATATGDWHALHLAPDEWLLAGPRDGTARVKDMAAASGVVHSLVDVSDRTLAVEVAGRDAKPLINAGCPLDLADAAFPVNACTRTLFGKASILLWRTAADSFRVEYARSFDAYVTTSIETAAQDLPEMLR